MTIEERLANYREDATVLAFLRDRLGKAHGTYLAAKGVPGMRERRRERPTPPLARAMQVRDALPERSAGVWWTMCTTGMGPKELDGRWSLEPGAVMVQGTKRESRDRILPRLGTPVRRAAGWKQVRADLAGQGVQPYDGRRVFAHLLEAADLPLSRQRAYMGHRTRNVTEGYQRQDVRDWLAGDRERLLGVLASAAPTARRKGLRRA